MREQYNKQLELLSEHMAEMGKLCVEAIQNAIWAFLKQDLEAVKNVERNENEINSIAVSYTHLMPIRPDGNH